MKKNLKLIQYFFFGLMILTLAVSTLIPKAKDVPFPGTFIEKTEGILTDLKFNLRGKVPLKNNIELIEIDNRTLEQFPEYGRWPWQRDPQAFLLYSILRYNPKLVVLDIIYAESESVRMPPELEEDLVKIGRSDLVSKFSPEAKLLKTLHHYGKKVVLTSGADSICLESHNLCKTTGSSANKNIPAIEKWALKTSNLTPNSPRIENPILNFPQYSEVGKNFGFSISQPDQDGIFRSIYLRFALDSKIYPALPVATLKAIDPGYLGPAENKVQVSFRTNIRSDHSTSAADVLFAEQDSPAGKLLREKVEHKIKDKIVVLGVTASAAGDYHSTPIGLLSGPEIVVTTIDNLLASDYLISPGVKFSSALILILIFLFGAAERYKNRISSRFIIVAFGTVAVFFVGIDAFFFSQNINLPSIWIYLFVSGYAFLILYEKYLLTESQKNFIKSAFSKYISPDFVNELVNNPEKLKIGGQKKELTVMFSDIRSFTTFSEKMDAKTLGEFLHEYLDEMTDIVFASRGTLDKYIGDAVMAFWGDPLEASDHAYSACEAAKKMIHYLNVKRPYYLEKYGVDLQVGIGINTGVVSVGNMGSSKSLGYTVIGDSVNLTSRLEGATKNYGVSILTTESTLDQIKASGHPLPSHRYLDSLKVKGKNKAVRIAQIFEQDVPVELISAFDQARQNYLLKNWNEAISDFEKCNQLYHSQIGGADPISVLFIERCKAWQQDPPPSDWDGSWKLESK